MDTPQTQRTERVVPVPDRRRGPTIPYRGDETHGVAPTADATDVPLHSLVPVEYAPVEPDPEPIPVRVVNETPRELKRFRVNREQAGIGQARMIAPQNDARTQVTIRNMSAARTIYIGDETSSALPFTGFPVLPNAELKMSTQTEVYCSVDDNVTVVEVAVLSEYNTAR